MGSIEPVEYTLMTPLVQINRPLKINEGSIFSQFHSVIISQYMKNSSLKIINYQNAMLTRNIPGRVCLSDFLLGYDHFFKKLYLGKRIFSKYYFKLNIYPYSCNTSAFDQVDTLQFLIIVQVRLFISLQFSSRYALIRVGTLIMFWKISISPFEKYFKKEKVLPIIHNVLIVLQNYLCQKTFYLFSTSKVSHTQVR